jgi:hypothetical protein
MRSIFDTLENSEYAIVTLVAIEAVRRFSPSTISTAFTAIRCQTFPSRPKTFDTDKSSTAGDPMRLLTRISIAVAVVSTFGCGDSQDLGRFASLKATAKQPTLPMVATDSAGRQLYRTQQETAAAKSQSQDTAVTSVPQD